MTKWEYWAVFVMRASFEDNLNKIGQVGWELVHVDKNHGDTYALCIFKRPIQEKAG